jgi:hypothetical protein
MHDPFCKCYCSKFNFYIIWFHYKIVYKISFTYYLTTAPTSIQPNEHHTITNQPCQSYKLQLLTNSKEDSFSWDAGSLSDKASLPTSYEPASNSYYKLNKFVPHHTDDI